MERKKLSKWIDERYSVFEMGVGALLLAVISGIVILSIIKLVNTIWIQLNESDSLFHIESFAILFGMVMTVLIAMEFNRSILNSLDNAHAVIQAKGVILIAILTVVRKLILLDVKETSALSMFGLAALVLSLGALYWFLRKPQRRDKNAITDSEKG